MFLLCTNFVISPHAHVHNMYSSFHKLSATMNSEATFTVSFITLCCRYFYGRHGGSIIWTLTWTKLECYCVHCLCAHTFPREAQSLVNRTMTKTPVGQRWHPPSCCTLIDWTSCPTDCNHIRQTRLRANLFHFVPHDHFDIGHFCRWKNVSPNGEIDREMLATRAVPTVGRQRRRQCSVDAMAVLCVWAVCASEPVQFPRECGKLWSRWVKCMALFLHTIYCSTEGKSIKNEKKGANTLTHTQSRRR